MKRLILIDFMKGIFMLFLILFHALGYNILTNVGNTIESVTPIMTIITLPIGILATWAGYFFIASGVLSAYVIFHQLKTGKIAKKIFLGSILSNILILIMHYLYVIFLIHPPPTHNAYNSLITGSIDQWNLTPLSIELLFFSSTLLTISLSGILTCAIILIYWKINKKNIGRGIYWVLSVIGAILLFTQPILEYSLSPFIDYFIEAKNYFAATIISWLVGPRFCIIPFAAFSLYGAIFGIALARKESWEEIKKLGLYIGTFYLIAGIISMVILGLPNFNAPIYGIDLNLIDLGLMILILIVGIKVFEFRTHEEKLNLVKKTVGIRRFGMLTLTIFMFDPLIGTLAAQICNLIAPGIVHNITFGVLVFIPMLFFLWWIILRLWERKNFKYSLEWIIGSIGKLRGYKSEKLDWQKNLYYPSFYEPENSSPKKK